jgi:hypothetical protein
MKKTGRYYVNWKMVLSEHQGMSFSLATEAVSWNLESHLQMTFYFFMLEYWHFVL